MHCLCCRTHLYVHACVLISMKYCTFAVNIRLYSQQTCRMLNATCHEPRVLLRLCVSLCVACIATPFLLHYLQHLFHIFCCRRAWMRLPHFHRTTCYMRVYLWANPHTTWALALLRLFQAAKHTGSRCVCFWIFWRRNLCICIYTSICVYTYKKAFAQMSKFGAVSGSFRGDNLSYKFHISLWNVAAHTLGANCRIE